MAGHRIVSKLSICDKIYVADSAAEDFQSQRRQIIGAVYRERTAGLVIDKISVLRLVCQGQFYKISCMQDGHRISNARPSQHHMTQAQIG